MKPAGPRDTLRSFAALFVATWFVQMATCSYSFGWGTLQLNQPVVLLLAALATHRHGLLGRRWRPRGSVIALASVLPGGTVTALAAGLLDLRRASQVALGSSQLGAFLIALWWLWAWGAELPQARRRAKLGAILLAIVAGVAATEKLLATAWAPPGGWPAMVVGTSIGGVPLSMVSTAQAAVLEALSIVGGLASLCTVVIVPASLWRAARLFGEEAVREPPEGASLVEPHRHTRRNGLLAFLGIGFVGSIAVVGSSLVLVSSIRLPTWLLGPVIWGFAAWFAGRWLDADAAVRVSKDGLLVDNRLEPWASFSSWEAAHDGFRLRGASGPRVIPLDEDDPRRAVVERWIEGDASAVLPAAEAAPPARPAARARRRPIVLLLLLLLAVAVAWGGGLVQAVTRGLANARGRRGDAEAVAGLRQIAAAEVAYRNATGSFGSLEELEKVGTISKDSLPSHIYFQARTTKKTPSVKWWAAAFAGLFGDEKSRTVFYTNETGQIWSLEIHAIEEGHWSWPTPDDSGDTSAPPPGAVLDTSH
jgi:hypothetical protein